MSKATFFRQSGWMMFATFTGGVLMWGVHFLSKRIPEAEYGTLVTMLSFTILIPTGPLQMVFTQQSALALATGRVRQLTGMVRLAWLWATLLWLVAAGVMLVFQKDILASLKIANSAALWVTMLLALCAVWSPMFLGLLQGEQNFLWLGGTAMLNGVARLGAAAIIVLLLGGYAAGILTGALIGTVLTLGICMWLTRGLWTGPAEPFDWRKLLAQVIPLSVGFGASQFLFSADTMFVKHYFSATTTGFYGAAGTLCRALIWGVGPLTAVMFPKIVHSTAKAEKSDLLTVTLLATGALAGGGAFTLWLLAPWVIPFVYKASYVEVAISVLPWYAGAMVPLSLTNVLINNLLARSRFKVVPWLLVLAVGYALTLYMVLGFYSRTFGLVLQPLESLQAVLLLDHGFVPTGMYILGLKLALQMMTGFCLLAFGLCAWFTWGPPAKSKLNSEVQMTNDERMTKPK